MYMSVFWFMIAASSNHQLNIKKLTQVYSHYPCEKPLMKGVFVKSG